MTAWIEAEGYAHDLQAAYDYFKQGGMSAAERFLNRYRRCAATIIERPKIFPIRPHGWRQIHIPDSTFSIFYGERDRFWILVGIQSTVQDPDRIQALLLIREVTTTG